MYFGILSLVLQGQQLKNPHLAVKHSAIAGGTMALVQGDYLYYHYMQDGFNDNVRLDGLSVCLVLCYGVWVGVAKVRRCEANSNSLNVAE